MKILFDANVSHALRSLLLQQPQGHTVFTAQFLGWDELGNGDLARNAEQDGYDILITEDKGFWNQKPAEVVNLACILLRGYRKRAADNVVEIVEAVETVQPGQLKEVQLR